MIKKLSFLFLLFCMQASLFAQNNNSGAVIASEARTAERALSSATVPELPSWGLLKKGRAYLRPRSSRTVVTRSSFIHPAAAQGSA